MLLLLLWRFQPGVDKCLLESVNSFWSFFPKDLLGELAFKFVSRSLVFVQFIQRLSKVLMNLVVFPVGKFFKSPTHLLKYAHALLANQWYFSMPHCHTIGQSGLPVARRHDAGVHPQHAR